VVESNQGELEPWRQKGMKENPFWGGDHPFLAGVGTYYVSFKLTMISERYGLFLQRLGKKPKYFPVNW